MSDIDIFKNFLETAPELDSSSILRTCVVLNKYEEVGFILSNRYLSIDRFHFNYIIAFVCEKENLRMFQIVIEYVHNNIQRYELDTLSRFLKISCFVPFVMDFFDVKLNKQLANLTILKNNKELFLYLIEHNIQDFTIKYIYVIIASGAGRNDILLKFIYVVKDVVDECIEISISLKNTDTTKFLNSVKSIC